MARRTMTDARLELEYFERIDVNPRLTLLRVGGTPAPDEDVLALVVSVDGEDFRTRPLGGSVSVEASGRWRAAFPVPSERLEGADLSYTLETGETVELPEPAMRVLPARAEEDESVAAPVEELAVAEKRAVAAEPAAEEEPAFTEAPLSPIPRRGRRWWLLALVALLIAVVVAVVIIVVASNSTDDNGTALSQNDPRGGRTPAALHALPEAPQGTTAEVTPISDGRATLTVSGLPRGTYEAWLYNEILDAKPLATFHGPRATVTLTIPSDAGHFRDLDVSREGDGNPGPSGQSVLRVPLAGLAG
jgi:hypothetical protein